MDARVRPPSRFLLRSGLLGFSFALGALAFWVLAAEALRPAAATSRERAQMAARIGVVRGDLWADYAAALEAGDAASAEDARAAAARSARLAPSQSRSWLMLARASARTNAVAAAV